MSDNLLYEQYFFTPDKTYLQSQATYISWAGHRVCDASHMIGPRVLDTYKIVFILSGSGYLVQDDNPKIRLNTNDMFILFANHRHHYWADPDDPWTIMWVAFNGADSPTLLSALHLTISNCCMRDALTESIKKTMHKLIRCLSDETDHYRLGAITELFCVTNKLRLNQNQLPSLTDAGEETLTSRIIAFIEQNYYMDIDMVIICQYIHYSRSYLSRIFKAEVGITIQDFLRDTRINKAKKLLLDTTLSIQEVAISVGINDSLYFSKLFRKGTGYSPRSYRNHFLP